MHAREHESIVSVHQSLFIIHIIVLLSELCTGSVEVNLSPFS